MARIDRHGAVSEPDRAQRGGLPREPVAMRPSGDTAPPLRSHAAGVATDARPSPPYPAWFAAYGAPALAETGYRSQARMIAFVKPRP
jgi:hypothetical protein